jgi:predicted Zn-dependent peptidase
VPDDEFAREKQVVVEEIRMYADEPDSVAMENLQKSLFPGHGLGCPVAGTPESLAPLKAEDLRRYIRSHYRADNTVVVVVGSFEKGRALGLVERAFSPLGRSRPRKRPAPSRFARPSPSHVSVEKDVQQVQLALGYRTFGVSDPRKYAATVMDAVLGRGMSSRLFQEVREKRGLSYDISSRMQFFSDAGMFTVTAGVDPSKASRALATTDRELRRICERRVSAAELRRTKDFLVGNFRLSHEKVTSKLFFYGQTMLAFGRLVAPEEQVAGIRAVTPADVQAAARSVFAPSARSVSWVVPRGLDFRP